ncbi:MAG: hypothetical protein JRJ59_09855, partial [Deltaproteobacteria bacterium]|nr:hypothetical protein [Deltaproteobacteria bacterium]
MSDMAQTNLSRLKEELQRRLPAGAHKIWIEPLVALSDDETGLVLGCPNQFSRNWVAQHYGQDIRQALSLTAGPEVPLKITVAPLQPPQPREDGPVQPELPYQPGRLLNFCGTFNPAFTFESFITGPSNIFAHQAAWALAKGEGMDLKALFLQADTGLGKSHLSQAVGLSLLDGAT